jgi:hypothetical protein
MLDAYQIDRMNKEHKRQKGQAQVPLYVPPPPPPRPPTQQPEQPSESPERGSTKVDFTL